MSTHKSAYRAAISKLTAKAGSTRSPAKAAAARRNGRLAKAGGRPVSDIPAEVLAEIRRRHPGRAGRYQRERERKEWRAYYAQYPSIAALR